MRVLRVVRGMTASVRLGPAVPAAPVPVMGVVAQAVATARVVPAMPLLLAALDLIGGDPTG
ncbi:hypothetical protein GCM10009560_30690 [Nonomuraea longicatena]|uniref:Uncharacterized protein n=1 Tax=Nonomuraea longicatena TaxID=83682 RepID=A0ABP3ZVL6_9ACTN